MGNSQSVEKTLILASTSRARRDLLDAAGVAFMAVDPDVDEDAVKAENLAGAETAARLAAAKALAISARYPRALVIGGDQVLTCRGNRYDKPADQAAARVQLTQLRGQEHQLQTALAVALDGQVIWRHLSAPRLRMRSYSDAFLEDYLNRMGDAVTCSAGAYQLENLGSQLFSDIDGDYFAILGMPLLPLLAFLRQQGLVKD